MISVLIFFFLLTAQGLAQANPSSSCEQPAIEILDSKTIEVLANSTGCRIQGTHFHKYGKPLLNSQLFGRLSPFWAQESVGADLTYDFLDKLPKAVSGKPVPVGIYDDGVDLRLVPNSKLSPALRECKRRPGSCAEIDQSQAHGTAVANLILGDAPIGLSQHAELAQVISIEHFKDQVKEAELLAKANPAPRLWNLSIVPRSASGDRVEKTKEWLNQVPMSSTLVVAAGNDYPRELDWLAKHPRSLPVGNLSPNGLMSDSSQAGNEVVISAPSDLSIQSIGSFFSNDEERRMFEQNPEKNSSLKKAMLINFSGTSGATPLVQGALANVLSLVPDLSFEDQKSLLRKTAIKTAAFRPNSGKNGAGALNAYLMARVAALIREKRARGESTGVEDPSIYEHFKRLAATSRKKAASLLRETPGTDSRHLDCDRQRDALRLLREAFFLDPSDETAGKAIATIYRVNGFESQADYFAASSASETVSRMAKLKIDLDGEEKKRLFRMALRAGAVESRHIKLLHEAILKEPSPPDKMTLIRNALAVGAGCFVLGSEQMKPALETLIRQYTPIPNDERYPDIISGLLKRAKDQNKFDVGLAIATLGLNHPQQTARRETVNGAYFYLKDLRIYRDFLKKLVAHPDSETRRAILDSATSVFGREQEFCALTCQWIAEHDPNPTIAQAASKALKDCRTPKQDISNQQL